MKVYLDGNLKGSAGFGGSPVHNADPLYIGRCGFVAGRNFKGLVDEVAIFNRAVPPE
jgi:hypothetical protein